MPGLPGRHTLPLPKEGVPGSQRMSQEAETLARSLRHFPRSSEHRAIAREEQGDRGRSLEAPGRKELPVLTAA